MKLGPTERIDVKKLTVKSCWLLAVCEIIPANDFNCIYDKITVLSDTSDTFLIVS
ncbi:hypothetical protein AYI68_g7932, partial [Smittium mucronatum]